VTAALDTLRAEHPLRCPRCGHAWFYSGHSTASGTSCPKCQSYVRFSR
jgi:DNA-directed RNA polymerase subunit RPC12/RpoP